MKTNETLKLLNEEQLEQYFIVVNYFKKIKNIPLKLNNFRRRIIIRFLEGGVNDCWLERYLKLIEISKGITKERMVLSYGEELGNIKWRSYCDKQSYSNTFEYKKIKYGWSKEDFDEYNTSRSVTKDNLIKRHGEELGIIKWKSYCDKQAYTNKLPYYIELYGNEEGEKIYNDICSKKALTMNNFVRLYGEIEGINKYNKFKESQKDFFSTISQQLFWNIYNFLPYNIKKFSYFAELNKEYGKMYDGKYVKYDFVNTLIKYCIEFNGNYWHLNPNMYKETDTRFFDNISAKEIWENDRNKNLFLCNKGFRVKVVWEEEYVNNKELIVNIIKEEINERSNF